MSLLRKLFGDKPAPPGLDAAGFGEDDELGEEGGRERQARRSDLLLSVCIDTLRQHGIPSDWIACRVMALADTGQARSGLYLTLTVRDGQDRLLAYVPAFQASLRQALARADERSGQWLLGITWQFADLPANAPVPPPLQATDADPEELAYDMPPQAPARAPADDLEDDLRALFAIRDAALDPPAQRADDPATPR